METKRSVRRKVEERKKLKKEQKKKVKKLKKPLIDRKTEYEENNYSLEKKVRRLAKWIEDAQTTLVYTGAGISTAANIPDYRGPNGVWTLAQQGKEIIRCGNIMSTEPTTSHMILKELHRQRYITHILSQNCDGLHLRSGLPQTALSEIHGNMNIEVCSKCERQHIRPYDVTAKSALQKHGTGRFCDSCDNELEDTIVHFGECGRVRWPLNWDGTRRHLPKANLIICVGTSLAVLKAYGELWPEKDQQTKVIIVNLQWTVKDKEADMKIHSKCDNFFEKLAYYLDIQPAPYCRLCDPVLNHLPVKEKFDKKRRNDIIRKINTCNCDGLTEKQNDRSRRKMSVNDEEEPSTSGEMPGWWAYGLKMQMNTGKKKGRGGKKKNRRESDQQIVQQVVKDLLDQLDPQNKGKSFKLPKDEPKSDEATDSENSEKEEKLVEMEINGKRKRKCSMKDRRVKTPELISRLGIEAGALLDDSQSNDSDSDDDYTITKQQMGSDHHGPGLRATRRSSNTQSTSSLLNGLPPRINKNRGQKRKREVKTEIEEIGKKKSLMTFKKETSMDFTTTSTSVSTPSMEDGPQGKGSPCSSISDELGTTGEPSKPIKTETALPQRVHLKNVEVKTEMTVREYISSQAFTKACGGLSSLKMDSSAKSKLSQLIQEVKLEMEKKEERLEREQVVSVIKTQKAKPMLLQRKQNSTQPIQLEDLKVLSSQMSVGEVLKMLKGGTKARVSMANNRAPNPPPAAEVEPLPEAIAEPLPEARAKPLPGPLSGPLPGPLPEALPGPLPGPLPGLLPDLLPGPLPGPLPEEVKVEPQPAVNSVMIPSQEPSLRREPNESLDDFLARNLPPEYYRQIEQIETPRGDPSPLSAIDPPGLLNEMALLAEEAYLLASRIKSDRPENSENQR